MCVLHDCAMTSEQNSEENFVESFISIHLSSHEFRRSNTGCLQADKVECQAPLLTESLQEPNCQSQFQHRTGGLLEVCEQLWIMVNHKKMLEPIQNRIKEQVIGVDLRQFLTLNWSCLILTISFGDLGNAMEICNALERKLVATVFDYVNTGHSLQSCFKNKFYFPGAQEQSDAFAEDMDWHIGRLSIVMVI